VRSFIEPDLFVNSVPFDNTTPIYLINVTECFTSDIFSMYYVVLVIV